MLKNKRILLLILVVLLLLILPNMVSASNEEPTISTEVYGANKSIKVTLEDITLDDLNEHKFGISKAKATEPIEWLDFQEIEASTCTAIITPENETHRNILRSNNKCYLFIKDTTNDEVKIITQVDLSLPMESALNTTLTDTNNFNISYLYRNASDIGSYYITAVKVDDTDIIEKYLEAKKNNQDTLSAVRSMLPTANIPTTSWKEMTTPGTYDYAYIYNGELTQYQGLYMIWGQVNYSEGRNIYGYVLYDNYPNDYVLPEENEPTTPPTTDKPTIDTTQNESGAASNVLEEGKLDTNNKEIITNKDNTIAPGTMPYTGGTFVVIISILGIVFLGVYAYKRKNDLKQI